MLLPRLGDVGVPDSVDLPPPLPVGPRGLTMQLQCRPYGLSSAGLDLKGLPFRSSVCRDAETPIRSGFGW